MRALLVLALAAALVSAKSITWTGYGNDNQWTNPVNWNTDSVPGQNDDVTINSGNVYCTIATGVNSLVMGTQVASTANLTLYQTFVFGNGGAQIQENGNLIIEAGMNTVFGSVQVGGNLIFVDGILSGAWTIAPRAAADLGNSAQKGFAGCTFTSQGLLSLAGVLLLNQSSSIVLQSATSSHKNLFVQNGDNSAVSFDASAATFTYSTGTFVIQAPVKLGVFTLLSGNMTIIDSLTFNNALNIPANSYVSAVGNAVLNVSAGVTGAGVLSLACQSATVYGASMTGFVNMIGGATVFMTQSDIAVLTLDGGNVVYLATVYPAQYNLLAGTTTGAGATIASSVLISTKGLTLGSTVTVNKSMVLQKSIVSFGAAASIVIAEGATATVTGEVLLTGAPNGKGVTNNGVIQATAALQSQNIPIVGSGSVTVASSFKVSQIQFTQKAVTLAASAEFSGMNTFLTIGKVASASGSNVDAIIGDYHFSCPAECDSISTPNTNPPQSTFSFTA